ncbi:DUF3891 family protein [Beijerinckia sp. L45]|uniref:DUF3891 family protein n=1 Tax=Beijerinckia sp. L45 TaxID=1641855 RepID=UPI00131B4288|nr:DUF3891 family protein [Beijerinckia sp. L45]
MIVRTSADGTLILINQTDHARLAGQFAAHWGNSTFELPRRRESLLRAATFHDAGWSRYETEPSYDVDRQATPTFFQVPNTAKHLAEHARAISWLSGIDPYAGLLMSMHRTGLWRNRYGAVKTPAPLNKPSTEPLVVEFIEKHEQIQRSVSQAFSKDEIATDYQMLQFFDVFSLAFCTKEFQEGTFELVPTGYGKAPGIALRMELVEEGVVKVSPFPFDAAGLKVGFLYMELAPKTYASETEFRIAYFAAPHKYREYTFV